MQSAINKDARPLNLILFKTDFIKELFLVSNTKLFQYLFFFFLFYFCYLLKVLTKTFDIDGSNSSFLVGNTTTAIS